MTTSASGIFEEWSDERRRVEARRAEIDAMIERLRAEREALPELHGAIALRRLADAMTAAMDGHEVEVLGPHGVGCAITLRFSRGDGATARLEFRPCDGDVYRIVDHSRSTGDYPASSVAARNGMNHPDVAIPDRIERLVAMLEWKGAVSPS